MYNIFCLFIYTSMEKGQRMIIDLSSALKHPGQSFPFSVEGCIDDIDLYGETIKFLNPIKIDGIIMNIGNNFFVRGEFTAEYQTNCDLCFRIIEGKVECEFDEEYSQTEDISHPDRYLFEGSKLDITKMVHDNICLELPLKHLCTEDCLGLCPSCGINLNEEKCDCNVTIEQSGLSDKTEKNKKDNPFAVLENLFSDDDEEA